MADVILHNRPIGTPSDSEFVAYGTPTAPSGQISFSNFYNLLMDKLAFFKKANLFSEIFGNPTATATARTNLDVPSILEMQIADSLKANKTNVIEKDSTISYTPTLGTHPVNKKYVDEKQYTDGNIFVFGDISVATTKTVNLGKNVGTNKYIVNIEITSTAFIWPVIILNKTNNSFDVSAVEYLGEINNLQFRWIILFY